MIRPPTHRGPVVFGAAVFVLVAVLAGCGDDTTAPIGPAGDEAAAGDPSGSTSTDAPATTADSQSTTAPGPPWPTPLAPGEVARWTVEVIERIDHDPTAFTQGLEVVDGVGYESTGRRGESTVRRFDPTTGEVTMSAPLADAVFAEGLTLIDDRLVQLTYTSGIAYVRSPDDLEVVDTFTYEGEGWGICAPGDDTLWLSDGTTTLRRLDGKGDRVIESVDVQGAGVAVGQLNELECVAGHVLANMWDRDDIAVIDPDAGRVVAVIDASALADEVAPVVAFDDQNVLNGIAVLDDGTLLLTGKRWPTLFRVRLVAD